MNTKNIAATAIACFVALALVGCGITSGTVTSKVVEPEREYHTYIYIDKVRIPQKKIDDKDFCLNIKATDGEEGYVCIEEELYNEIEVGDHYAPTK